jgi:hypothetical protein
MNKFDIKEIKLKLNKRFHVPIIESLSEGVNELVDYLEEINVR